ncbi:MULTISPECIES: spore photoproduct lyase family protein [unclassified Pseudodesulfovibrio]|uniref:SPL family radical SAM protein n=1 Tax=unclassified Pseudodesulfovibrio TaxID=2661612 RepID=UPI000FEB7F7C|nr:MULTISPECIES: radical SAM protein [unclassified Pseudodesulfovibrio]MCJ2163138.1 radical SAM protein [Pseudodesulfovibrio sp. S3-i]RWU07130.1 radical SAM protein [Pseudodesulfovibrio sp. S3]
MTRHLPAHLRKIGHVFVDESMQDSPIANRVRETLAGTSQADIPWTVVSPDQDRVEFSEGDTQALYLKEYKGKFLRFCPGTRAYHCCGYRIIHIGENCPMACSYCILQAYFQDRVLKIWANQDDLFTELDNAFSADRNTRYRVGTGEFTDSLALEHLTGYSHNLIQFLEGHDNVVLELKSKVVDLSWMNATTRADRVLPAWSLNAPFINEHEEFNVSTLTERLEAARTCAEAGFRVCLHFDPVIHYPGWKQGYTEIIDRIFDYVRPEQIAYMSIGSFRCMPQLTPIIADNFPDTTYIYNEFVPGLDGKARLLRPLRVEQFMFMVDRLRSHGMDEQLYFCMESTEVWKEVFGYAPKDFGGLNNRLMTKAFGE